MAMRVTQFVCFYIILVLPYFISGSPGVIPLLCFSAMACTVVF